MRRLVPIAIALSGLLLLCGWDYPLSDEALSAIDWGVEYRQVRQDPEAWRGATLLLGGMVVEHVFSREGSTLEVLCYRLDRYDRPEEVDPECGRFLAEADRPFDPETYETGRLVTLAGKVAGRRSLSLDDKVYDYPLFEIAEIHLWPRPPLRLHPPLYPWYDDPFCDPYRRSPYDWHDPWYRRRCW